MLPWTRRMQSQHPRRKTRKEAGNFQLNVWKWWIISINFQNSFVWKWFHRYEECSFDRPAKLFLLNYRKWSEKKSTKSAKTFQKIFFKKLPRRCRKQLESHADFFRTASRNIFARNSRKKPFVGFAKDLPPKVSIETENPVLTTPLLFLRGLVKKIAQCPKWRKIEIKLCFVKMLTWTRRIQFQHPRR